MFPKDDKRLMKEENVTFSKAKLKLNFVLMQCESEQSSTNRSNNGTLISHNVVEWCEVVAYDAKLENFTCKICNKVILSSNLFLLLC